MSFVWNFFRARKASGFTIPVPVASPEEWGKHDNLVRELGFRSQEYLNDSSYAVWPSAVKIYTHEVFDAYAELTLLPTEEFEIQFTTLFPEESVRTIAGEKRLTLQVLSFEDRVEWISGSLTSVWQEHMSRASEHEKEYRTHPVPPDLELYHHFLNLFQTRFMQAVREDRLIPQTVRDHLMMGYAYLRLDKRKKALEMFKALSGLEPENAQLHWLTGRIALVVGDFKVAAEGFRRCLLLKPAERDTYFLMAEAFRLLNKKRQVFHVLNRAKEFFPKDPAVSLRLGTVAVDVGELKVAHQCLEEINNSESASVELFTALGKLYSKMKNRKKSEEYFRLARVFSRQRAGVKLPWEL